MVTRALAGLAVLLLACDSIQIYRVEGRIVSVDAPGQRLEIAHDDIEGLMPAMVMHFDVAEPGLLEGVEPGYGVRFELERRGARLRILALEVTDTQTSGVGQAADFLTSSAPDFELVDQDGHRVRLDELRGKVLLVDFIFTRCPGPCPIQTAQHVSLQRSISPALAARTWFVSITLDPDHDTPAEMKAYAQAHGADLANWSFLSGDYDTVRRVAQAYHVAPSGPLPSRQKRALEKTGPLDHVMARYLIGPDGRIARRYVGAAHVEAELLRDLTEILG